MGLWWSPWQRVQAELRHHLVRMREHSESIALDRGETLERQQSGERFTAVLSNYLALIRREKQLTWFTMGYSQAAVVFPFIEAEPRFFSDAIQLGQLMQISSAFGRVQASLSWFVDSYSRLAEWHATTDRLTSFEQSFQALQTHRDPVAAQSTVNSRDALALDQLQLGLPDGTPLMATTGLQVTPGDSLLIKGPSGSGKSTLFRAIAGIWPWARAKLQRPPDFDDRVMFLPQNRTFPTVRCATRWPTPPRATATPTPS